MRIKLKMWTKTATALCSKEPRVAFLQRDLNCSVSVDASFVILLRLRFQKGGFISKIQNAFQALIACCKLLQLNVSALQRQQNCHELFSRISYRVKKQLVLQSCVYVCVLFEEIVIVLFKDH